MRKLIVVLVLISVLISSCGAPNARYEEFTIYPGGRYECFNGTSVEVVGLWGIFIVTVNGKTFVATPFPAFRGYSKGERLVVNCDL